ncbi:hypothetical protein DIPPA_30958 [Diplonema papillatum]|nr:hypothetical protein DIPPA_30958 [Diplonema papillatum]
MLSRVGARILGLAPGKAWCGSWANGPVMPSLHLPTYFELKEIGTNFRYKTDPDWVIDVIHQDCVREEGLTYVAEAATYSVTFFQLVNYCSRRGYEVTAFGVHNHDSGSSRSGKRWAVLYNKELQAINRADAPPPHLRSTTSSGQDIDDAVRSGRLIKWGDQLIPSERKMKPEDMLHYTKTPQGGRVAPAEPAVIHQPAGSDEQGLYPPPPDGSAQADLAGAFAAVDAETRGNLRDELLQGVGEKKRGRPDVVQEYLQDDLSLKFPPDERRKRGL